MTAAAGTFFDRLVQNLAAVHPGFGFLVAAIAELALFLQQQSGMARRMGIMAAVATLFGDRRMYHLALELGAVMTLETGGSRTRRGPNHAPYGPGKDQQQSAKNPSVHYCPSA